MDFPEFRAAVSRGLNRHKPGICISQVEYFINLTSKEYLSKVEARQDSGSGKQILRPIFAGVAAKMFDINPAHDPGRAVHVADLIIEEMALAVA